MIISNENEIKLANKVLNDKNTYKLLESDETPSIISKINNELKYLKDNDHINESLFSKLLINEDDEVKCGKLKVCLKFIRRNLVLDK